MHPTALPRAKRARVCSGHSRAAARRHDRAHAGCGGARHVGPGSRRSRVRAGRVGAGREGPVDVALDAATHTIYVANGYNDNGPNAGGNTVSVIDARHCQAQDVSRCKGPWPTITVGNLPSTDRDRPADRHGLRGRLGDNTVSVFNGATCNALDTSGCGQTPATVPVGLRRSASSTTRPTTPCTSPTSATARGRQHDRLDARQRDLQRDRSRRLPGHSRRRPSTSGQRPMTSTWTRPPTPCT